MRATYGDKAERKSTAQGGRSTLLPRIVEGERLAMHDIAELESLDRQADGND
jgi:hypothetical protein